MLKNLLIASLLAISTSSFAGFIPNQGQLSTPDGTSASEVKYYGEIGGTYVYITNASLTYSRSFETEDSTTINRKGISLEFIGANSNSEIQAYGELPVWNNYYLGHLNDGITNVHEYKKLVISDVWSNIDVELFYYDRGLKYQFVVHPGGDVNDIKLKYNGADEVVVKEDGSLEAMLNDLPFSRENAPYSFQVGREVSSQFKLIDNQLTFQLGDYDHTKKLVIDPWTTYYGGSGVDEANGVTNDSGNNVITVGYTTSSLDIATVGAHDVTLTSGQDGMIVKFDQNNVRLWATYYGGFGGAPDDLFEEVAVDASDAIYVVGKTTASSSIATTGSHQTSHGVDFGDTDAMLVKFNSAGVRQWATYYGGDGSDEGFGVFVSGSDVYISGTTTSSNNIGSTGSYSPSINGVEDAFLAKFTTAGTFQWGTYFGGTDEDNGLDVVVDGSGNPFIGGYTYSSGLATAGAHQTTLGGGPDSYFAQFNSTGTSVTYCSYYGGTGNEFNGFGMGHDASNNLYIAGQTSSDSPSNEIATPGAFNTSRGSIYDGYMVKFNAAGVRQWGTYLGGAGSVDIMYDVICDAPGNTYITGYVRSNSLGLATTPVCQETHGGGTYDAFIYSFDGTGSRRWSTYMGGDGNDFAYSIAIDNQADPRITIVGETASSDFFTTGAYDITQDGSNDAFIARVLSSDGTCAPSTLPVELIDFKGTREENKNHLNWTTASERNNDYFEIQRSTNGVYFETIGKRQGAGNTTAEQQYSFTDDTPFEAYYRLKQVDIDGAFEYSDLILLHGRSNDEVGLILSPNPAKETAQVISDTPIVSVLICDATGKVVLETNHIPNMTLDIAHLDNGIYLVSITDVNGIQNSSRLIVSNQ